MPLQNLTGTEESTADTLRYWLATQGPPNNTIIISEGGFNTTNTPLTDNDMLLKRKDKAVFVQLRDGNIETLDQSPTVTFGFRTTYVDIYGRHAYTGAIKDLERVRDWIDGVLQSNSRKQMWVQAGDTDEVSSITGLRRYSCDWEMIEGDIESGIINQLSGELETYWQRNS